MTLQTCSELEHDLETLVTPKPALDVNHVFAYRLRDARLSKQWNQQDLADAMDRIGHTINRATIAKIEAGARGAGGEIHGSERGKRGRQMNARPVSLLEAVAFAVALDVPPQSLFLPIIRDNEVQLAANVSVDVEEAHAWARGEGPLDQANRRFYRYQSFESEKPPPVTPADLGRLGIRMTTEP
jgi:transcriptional regulator with XRE-family HTH domain